MAAIPPAIKIEIISDRTQTIRAAVEDVQFTLLFYHRAGGDGDLRVPAQLLGHGDSDRDGAAGPARRLRADVGFGYTLDNLSLMALAIAVGFVVDDAIVMLENITRYIEAGEKPRPPL